MTPDEHRRKLLSDWARMLAAAGIPRDETDAHAGALWQSLIGHGARVTWLPDTRPAATAAGHVDHHARAAAARAAVRPGPAAVPDPPSLLGTPPWRTDPDRPVNPEGNQCPAT